MPKRKLSLMEQGPMAKMKFLKLTAIVSFLYFITGHFGLYLALPPGFATVVWPASGIALALVLSGGNRALYGVAIGSFLINSTSRNWDFSPSFTAFFIACGASLQTYVGVLLLRGAKELPLRFLKPRSIIYFFGFVAPVSCFVSASIGMLTLYLKHLIAQDEAFINWLTWFFGDTLGIMLFTPLILLIINRNATEWKERAKYLFPSTILSLVVFLLIFLYASKRESEKVEARSRKDASEVKLLVETKMLLYERLILSVTGLYRSNTEVLLDDFNEFIEASSVGLKGFNGISWIPKLQGKDLPAFQTWLEQQGVTDFALRKLDGKPIRDILPNETYYPLTFYTRREIAGFRGVDLGQSAQRLSVMLAAQESLHSQTIANISFIGNRAGDKGSILIQPIVKRDKSNEKTNVIGFICFGFRPAEAFAEALAHAEELNLDLQVSNSKGDILLSTNSAGSRPFRPNSYLSSETMMNWQADQWKIRISPKQVYFAKNRSWDTWAILMIGLTFCAAIQVFILVITGSHYKVSVQVRERTKELDDSRKNLMIARDEAIKANDAKGIFLANMSHEIRTPLNGIIGITKLLAATPLNSKQRMWLHHLEVSNRGLMYLINDILDLSKIEAGALTLRSEPMDPKQIVDESIQTLSALAEAKDLKITLRVDPEMPERIQGDAFRIRQVMLNIISNAIKFTERGSIAIRVSPVEEDGQAFWTITTIDTGIGMSPEVLSRIFHVFTQGNDSIQQGARGSGLGLTISREIVELMDGRLDVESIEGQGSNFRVTLPLVEASPGAGDRKPQESHFILDETRKRDFKVLLVEDNEVNRIVASGLLNEMGLEADVAVDGQEALQAAKKGVYDIILMDIHMPNLNGLEATQEIRKLPIKRAFIIALTADATAKERDICRAAGMDAFISKPIDYRILNELISSQLEGKNSLGFDIPDLRKKFQSIEQILIQTLNVYFPLFHQTKIELLKAAKEKDRRATTRIFHSLKGMILNFPAAQMHSDLQELEHRFLQAAAGEEDYESITGFLNRIEIANHDLDALLRELKSR